MLKDIKELLHVSQVLMEHGILGHISPSRIVVPKWHYDEAVCLLEGFDVVIEAE